MCRLALLSFVLAASVQAQDVPADRSPSAAQRGVLIAGSVAGGVVTAPFIGPFAPLGVIGGAVLTGGMLGLDTSAGDLVVAVAIGTGVGVVTAYGVAGWIVYVGGYDLDLGASLFAAGAGLVAMAVTTGYVYGDRAEVAPVVLDAPTGERAPGLRLRLAF